MPMTDPSNFVNQHADRWTIPESMVEYEKKIATLKRELKESAEEMLRIISDVKYITGIVERGTGKPIGDDIPVAGAILEYVKSLERERDELKDELRIFKSYR